MFGVPRVNGMLAVSRAIGDDEYKQFGVISEPEVWEYEEDELKYVVVACDGLFDVMSNQEVDCVVRACFAVQPPEEGYQESEEFGDRRAILEKVSKMYMDGQVQEADALMLQKAGMTFVNFKVAIEPDQNMTKEERCACILTRIAYLLGSTDNITCLVGVVDEV